MKALNMQQLGRRVAGKRNERGVTQAQLAQQIAVTQRTISLIETGGRSGLSVGTLAAVAEALGVSLDYLVYGET